MNKCKVFSEIKVDTKNENIYFSFKKTVLKRTIVVIKYTYSLKGNVVVFRTEYTPPLKIAMGDVCRWLVKDDRTVEEYRQHSGPCPKDECIPAERKIIKKEEIEDNIVKAMFIGSWKIIGKKLYLYLWDKVVMKGKIPNEKICEFCKKHLLIPSQK